MNLEIARILVSEPKSTNIYYIDKKNLIHAYTNNIVGTVLIVYRIRFIVKTYKN